MSAAARRMCTSFDPALVKVPIPTKLDLYWDIRIFSVGRYNTVLSEAERPYL